MRNHFFLLQWDIIKYLYNSYKEQYIKLDSNKTELLGTWKMLSIIDKWIDSWVTLCMQTIIFWTSTFVNIIFVTYLLFHVVWFAPIMLYILLIVVLLIVVKLSKGWHIRRWKRNDMQDEWTRHNVKMLMSKFEILLNGKIAEENKIYSWIIDEMSLYDNKKNFYEHWSFNTPSIMLAIITVSLFLLLWYRFFYQNTIMYADIVLYLWLISTLETGIRDIVALYKSFIQNFQRVEKLWTTFDTIPTIIGYDIGKEFIFQKWDILFDNITLCYEEANVLSDFSLNIIWGKKTALVWISWAGKSTIIKLIAWYIHSDSGSILIDQQSLPNHQNDANAVSLKSYYKNIWYLTQEPSVFDGTIYENLIYALDYEPTLESLEFAIEQAQCSFVNDFPKWLQTQIWEKWVRLSWWQRQRLAIAKIFLKNPMIILLDEPTSALDSISEEAITKALDKLFENRTVIIVAHRLQTVKKADDIIVLDGWIITERWTHDQLVWLGGAYAKMLELQSWF